MTHGRGPKAPAILESLATALNEVEPDTAAAFAALVDSCLADPQAKQLWRDLMTAMQYFFRHPLAEEVREQGREQGRNEGRVEDRAETVLDLLRWRGIEVPESVRRRVEACTDLEQLKVWSQRAVQVSRASELFEVD